MSYVAPHIFEVPQIFKPTKDGPIDANTHVSSRSNLATELLVRSVGYLYWVVDESLFYVFVGGVSDTNFTKLTDAIKSGNVRAVAQNIPINSGQNVITHGGNSSDIAVVFYSGNERVVFDYSLGNSTGIDPKNKITVTTKIPYSSIRVVVFYQ